MSLTSCLLKSTYRVISYFPPWLAEIVVCTLTIVGTYQFPKQPWMMLNLLKGEEKGKHSEKST